MIEAVNLFVKIAGAERLRGAHLRAVEGETTLIVGLNGSGKSTLLRALAGDLKIASGEILLDGSPASKNRRLLRKTAALMRQREPALPGVSVERYLRACASDRSDVDEAAALFEIESLRGRLLERLSPGEERRVDWARAALIDARALLLDEPLADLDPAAKTDALGILAEFKRMKKTMLIAANAPEAYEPLADAAAALHEGRVAASGRTHEIKREGETWADALLRLAAEAESDAP